MKTQLRAKIFVPTLLASMMLLAGSAAQAAPTRAELDEVSFAQSLKEAGYTFPAIEDAVRVRNEAIARAEANKAVKAQAVAKAKAANSNLNN